MSFILDALKKSENARQRSIGPSLADAPPRRQQAERPWWALAVGALLVVNLGVLLIVLTRDNDKPAPTTAATATAVAAAATMVAQPPATPTRAPAPVSRPQPGNSAAPAANPAVRSLAEEADDGYDDGYGEALDAPSHPDLAAAANVPPGPSIVRPIEAPAVAPLPPGAAASAVRFANESTESLPTLGALAATGVALPDLHLDIHVYSTKPAERFVFVNMRKYHEGDTLSEGPAIERITPDGAVLNQQGQRFVLPRP